MENIVKSKKMEEKYKKKKRKPSKLIAISQYSMEGKLLRRFDSIKAAVEDMEISHKTILAYLHGKRRHTGGYLWGYDKYGL